MSLCVQELHHHTRFSLNSCSHSGISEQNWSHRSFSWSSFFFLLLDFWLAWSVSLTVLSIQHVHLTQILDRNLSQLRSSLALVSLSLDTAVVGEVDEEDVGWSISCLEGVIDVEEGKLEEELDDKPGTTIGTKFSVLHCIRVRFFNEMWFFTVDPLERISVNFPSDNAAVSRTFTVKNISNSKSNTVAFSCVCTSLLAVMTIVWLNDFVTISSTSEFKSFWIDHMHRRAGVNNKFSVLRFKIWWRKQAPIFRRWDECFIGLFYIWCTFGQLPRCFTGVLVTCLFLRQILKILELWGCVDEVHLGKSSQAMDFGLEFLCDVQ